MFYILAEDADPEDIITYDFEWIRNTGVIAQALSTTSDTEDTLDRSIVSGGVWMCEVIFLPTMKQSVNTSTQTLMEVFGVSTIQISVQYLPMTLMEPIEEVVFHLIWVRIIISDLYS